MFIWDNFMPHRSCYTFEVTAITNFRGLNMMGMELSYSISCNKIGKTKKKFDKLQL